MVIVNSTCTKSRRIFCFQQIQVQQHSLIHLLKIHKVKVAQLCPTLYNPMDYTVHGILQARILKWVAFPFLGDLPNPGIKPRSPTLQADSLSAEPQGSPRILEWGACPFSSGSSLPRNQTGISCIASRFFTYQVSLILELSGKPN